ncbi:MAG TPA: tetratricopeptide repeat protein [Vicinamibacteria bacterium]
MTPEESRPNLTAVLGRPDGEINLAEAALLIAGEEYPDLDVPRYLKHLDDMGLALRARLADEPRPERAVMALNRYLFQEEGFHGNVLEFYDPRNSYLNEVIDRRVGIPITLSTIYMEVARRAGLHVEGVGLPGHFIVRVVFSGHGLLVDPFHGGVLLTEADCQERLDRIFAGRVKIATEMLAATGRREILGRMLRNLKAIFLRREDYPRALRAADLLLCLDPESAEDRRDRGILYAALDCYGLALNDLEAYLARHPDPPEAIEIAGRIAALRLKASRLN